MKILIIEDQEELAHSLKMGLNKERFAVDLAFDGEKGSLLACKHEYDLIILDLNLPKKHGPVVCQEIRLYSKHVPILVLSVITETVTKVDLLNFGVDDYLVKPFSFDELLARVRALLRRPKSYTSNKIIFGNITLDTTTYTVNRAGRKLALTPKEYMILEYLVRNKGKIVPRSTLIEHIWDSDLDSQSNALEMHILRLRRKIEFTGKHQLIKTVTGIGYRVD